MNDDTTKETGGEEAADRAPAVTQHAPLRLWPAVVILVIEACGIVLPGIFAPGSILWLLGKLLGPLLGTLAILIWWAAFSRTPGRIRGVVATCFLIVCVGVGALMDRSMGMPFVCYWLPLATVVWVALLAWTGKWAWRRRATLVIAGYSAILASLLLFRLHGTDGSLQADLALRWQPLPEDAALDALREYEQSTPDGAAPIYAASRESSGHDWPEFRGLRRDGTVSGFQIDTNWIANAPVEIWRRPVGPGWSSFAVVGALVFTQEQRGDDETVVCYDGASGDQVWAHVNQTKFHEAMGGVGPRATPTVAGEEVYSLGATGRFNCLEKATGEVVWSTNIAEDTGAKTPTWGFSSSPLVCGDLVIVYAGAADAGMVAYDCRSGKTVWTCKAGTHSYSSPHLAQFGDTELVLMMSNAGLTAVEPIGGSHLWEYAWPIEEEARIVQPTILPGGEILVGSGHGKGTHCVAPVKDGDRWRVDVVWKSRFLKPYFNDLVYHNGRIYGFDDKIMTCLDPASGDRVWKGGRYGHGQLVLLADQDALLVLSERGDVALVEAKPEGYKELAKFHALDGKTWNHPVVVDGKLFVRNAEEAVCYRLPVVGANVAN